MPLSHLERVKGYLARLGEISQQALREMRLLVYELRPLVLKDVSLAEALQQRLDAVERRAGIDALQHGASTSVVVRIDTVDKPPRQRVTLEVADNGVGFEPDALHDQGGIRLASMKGRSEILGGDLVVRSSLGDGTRVMATIPVPSTTLESRKGRI